MKVTVTGIMLMGAVALTGCATPDAEYVAYRQKMEAAGKYSALTGSKFNGDSTSHTLKIVGNKEYNDNRVVNSLGNEIANQVKNAGKPGN